MQALDRISFSRPPVYRAVERLVGQYYQESPSYEHLFGRVALNMLVETTVSELDGMIRNVLKESGYRWGAE